MKSIVLSVFLSLAATALGCTCRFDWTPEDSYCSADFGILVYVKNEGKVKGWTRKYDVQLLVAYKLGPQDRDLLDKTHVYTASNSALCGVILQEGKYYVLSGSYERRGKKARFRVGLCDYIQRFDNNPKETYKPPNCYVPYESHGSGD